MMRLSGAAWIQTDLFLMFVSFFFFVFCCCLVDFGLWTPSGMTNWSKVSQCVVYILPVPRPPGCTAMPIPRPIAETYMFSPCRRGVQGSVACPLLIPTHMNM